ncbi:MAG: phosphatidate cytidylyltransferase [Nitrospinota bacterium]|nr:phosphatidate cytidylyltransferase [Nitrospinota bacterium]MDH5679852.1 phosphatidate cytidylyltransferase [Nitrospinota bacterium]
MIRLASGLTIAFALLLLILYGSAFHFFCFALFVSGMGAYEFFDMLKSGGRPSPVMAGVPAVVAITAALYLGPAQYGAIAILALFILSASVSVFGNYKDNVAAGAYLTYGAVFIGAPMAALALIRAQIDGQGFVIMLITATAMCDTGAFYVGKNFGKRKLAPKLSPGKTVEGFIGGIGGAVLGAVVVWWLMISSLNATEAVIAGLLVGLLGPIGDLAESAIKRNMGVKDAGSLIPGHGGVLDRVDSLLFTSAAFYLFLQVHSGL